MWLWKGLAEKVYPSLKHIDHEGNSKSLLRDISPCTMANCPCLDLDLESTRTSGHECICGHRSYCHTVERGNFEWVVLGVALVRQDTMRKGGRRNWKTIASEL